jgi:dipeptidyl aminopeptidase/acylaminoacyl peptidase
MPEPIVKPYGSWKSPITASMAGSADDQILYSISFDGEEIYWLERRPEEGGRYVLVHRSPDGANADVTPPSYNVRTRAHEYGGGAYTVSDRTIYFSNYKDQRVYRQLPNQPPVAITPEAEMRFADYVMDRRLNRLICVREDHTWAGREPVNELVAIDLDGDAEIRVLESGDDFYASPRLSPDGYRLAWLSWNHPNMPWDGTELWVGEINTDGTLGRMEKVAGGEDVSIFQPEWGPDGSLYFVSDQTGWWNIYRRRADHIESVYSMEAEFGRPQWMFGMRTYGFVSHDQIVCAYTQRGMSELAMLDVVTKEFSPIKTPYTYFPWLLVEDGRVAFVGTSPTIAEEVVELDLEAGTRTVLASSSALDLEPRYLSTPEPVTFPTAGGEVAHGFFYPPKNGDYAPPPNEKPPLVVYIHGGPTSMARTSMRLDIQFWASRGFGVLDVNYRGSTGYGRDYRRRLYGQWGVADVDDCVYGAAFLAERGEVDGDRLAIRGGSAGGFTTLAALAFRDRFAVGASYYGVSDLSALATDTHKFESRYLDQLIGPYPEQKRRYDKRSPINAIDQISCPVILFQGLEDEVVPPSQSLKMFDALRSKGVPVAYLPFEGEQHGFRQTDTVRRTLEAELYFYARIFGFSLAESVDPVEIENL